MMEHVTDNVEEHIQKMYRSKMSTRKYDVIVFRNNQPYAEPLHHKTGFFVFNNAKAIQIIARVLNQTATADPKNFTYLRFIMALEVACYEYIAWLQSKTGELRPPVRIGRGKKKRNSGMRQAYQGGWSDVRGWLAKSYTHKINQSAQVPHGPAS